jgi:CheY-like chemotaxis protein
MASKGPRHIAGRRLLVVEDEYLIASDLASWLEEQGAEVLGPVPSVSDALALLETKPAPNAAVLDINLGDEQVFPVADALQAAAVPFVFVSGYDAGLIPADYESVRRCAKPLDRSRLLRALGEVLQG